MRSEMPVLVDVEAAASGPGPCREPRDGFLDLKTFLNMRFISLVINVKEKRTLDYISGVEMASASGTALQYNL